MYELTQVYFFNKIIYALCLEECYCCYNILRRENFSTFQQMFCKPQNLLI